jgi:diguanylate cyclase (GGDEF)-like protein
MLDYQSVAYVMVPAFVAAVFAQLVNWRVNRDAAGAGWWTAGLVLQAVGVIIRARVSPVSGLEGIVVPVVNLLVVGGQFVLLLGLCRFAGRPMFRHSTAVVLGVFAVAMIYFNSIDDNVVIRAVLIACGTSAAVGLQFSLLPSIARREGIGGVIVLVVAYGLTVVVMFGRAAGLVIYGAQSLGTIRLGDDLSLIGRQAITSVAATLIGTAYAYGFIVLVSSRNQWRLQQLATVDALTGVPNRRAFEAELLHAASRVKRNGSRLGLALLDLDRFKLVNDKFGHETGDALLRHFAVIASGALREIDFFARVGGEEFALLITDATIDSLHQAAERIRLALEARPLVLSEGVVSATVSAGAAVSAPGGGDIDHLFAAADAALYRAKEEGRNRVLRAPVPGGVEIIHDLDPTEAAR